MTRCLMHWSIELYVQEGLLQQRIGERALGGQARGDGAEMNRLRRRKGRLCESVGAFLPKIGSRNRHPI